jgi:hypothetical protein
VIADIPLPLTTDPVDAPYWAGAMRGELLVQGCGDCGALRFPPRPMCPHCRSEKHRWRPLSGRGRIWSFAAPQPPLLPAFESLLPYITALVELEEDPTLRIVGPVLSGDGADISGLTAADVAIGQPVRVAFWHLSDDVALPAWVPLQTGELAHNRKGNLP